MAGENFISGRSLFQAGRFGGPSIGLVVLGVDAGATGLLRKISAESLITEKNIGRLSTTMGIFGTTLTGIIKTLSVAAIGVGAAAVAISTFDKTIAETAAISDAEVGQVFEKVGKTAINLSKEFGTSATAIAGAARLLSQAGLSLDQVNEALPAVTEFAIAVGGDLVDSVDLAVKIMAGFGLEASDITNIMNTLTFVVNQSPAEIEDLRFAFKQLTPVAGQLGITLESTAAAVAAVSRAGLSGETGGTSLATGLLSILDPTDRVDKKFKGIVSTFKETLIATGDIAIAFDSFLRAQGVQNGINGFNVNLKELRDLMKGTDSEIEANVEAAARFDERFKVLNNIVQIFGVRSTKAWLDYSANAGQARADTIAMELQLVRTDEAARKAIQNISSQASRIKNQLIGGILESDFAELLKLALADVANRGVFDELGQELGDELVDILNALVNNVDSIEESLQNLVPVLHVFGETAKVSAGAMNTLLKIFNAIPDPIISFALSVGLLNKLIGNNIRNLITHVQTIASESAQRKVISAELEKERLQREQGLLLQKAQIANNAGEVQSRKAVIAAMALENAELRRNLTEKSATLTNEITQLKVRNVVDSSRVASITKSIAALRTQIITEKEERVAVAQVIKEKQFEIATINQNIRLRNVEIAGREHNIRVLSQETAAQVANNNAKRAALASVGAGVKGSNGLPLLPVISRTGARAAAGAAAGGLAARGATAAFGGPVGIALTVLTLIPLLASLSDKSKSSKDNINSLRASLDSAASGFDQATLEAVGLNEALEEQAAKSALLISLREGNILSETFAIDVRGKTLEELDLITKAAEEQGKELISIQEATNRGIDVSNNEAFQKFIQGKEHEAEVVRQTAKYSHDIQLKGQSKTEQFFFKSFVNIGNFGLGAFIRIGQYVSAFAFAAAGVIFAFGGGFERVFQGIFNVVGEGFQFLTNGIIDGINVIIESFNKISPKNIGLLGKVNFEFGKPFETLADFLFEQADESFELAKRAVSKEKFDEALEALGGYAKIIDDSSASQKEVDLALQDFLIVLSKTNVEGTSLADILAEFVDNAGDFGKIGKRLQQVSTDTINGMTVLTPTFFELQNTGFKLSSALSQFADFFLTKASLDIVGEISNVFTTLGKDVPAGFDVILSKLQAQLLTQATSISNLFDPATFNAETFIEILAKAMESPRFEQNNNIIVRISSAEGTENAAALADNIVRELKSRGANV